MRRPPIDSRLLARLEDHFFPLRVTIQQPIEARDARGAIFITWQNLAGHIGIPATTQPLVQMEQRGAQLVTSETTHRMMLTGYFPAITPKMRLLVDNLDIYDVTGIAYDPHRNFTQLEVRVVTP